ACSSSYVFFSSRSRHTRFSRDWSSDVCSSDLGRNSLHGGATGFHTKVWDRRTSFKKKIDFCYVSPDGEEGFPGNLKVTVAYELKIGRASCRERVKHNEDDVTEEMKQEQGHAVR